MNIKKKYQLGKTFGQFLVLGRGLALAKISSKKCIFESDPKF